MKALKYTLIAAALTLTGALAADLTDGEVRKVDKQNGKITLKHGEIKNLEMPPMTMVFQVKNAAFLEKFKAGDKVRFAAASENGKLVVLDMQPVK